MFRKYIYASKTKTRQSLSYPWIFFRTHEYDAVGRMTPSLNL